MRARWWLGSALAVGVLATASSAGLDSRQDPRTIPLPALGNVSVARLVIVAQGTKTAPVPPLAVTGAGKLPETVLVLGAVRREPGKAGRFSAALAIFNRPWPATPTATSPPPQAVSPTGISLRLPSGYSVGSQQLAANVLYENNLPGYPLGPAAPASVLAGAPPPKIAPSRLLADALKLAVDRNVAVADMELLGLQYVSASVGRSGGPTSYAVTIGVSRSSQVNAVQLTFPKGVVVARGAGPPRATVSPFENNLQLIAPDRFQEAVPYRFTFELSRPLSPGSFFTLRASTHYFENVLPFTERFYAPA